MELTAQQKRRERKRKEVARMYITLRGGKEAKSNLMILRTIEAELPVSLSTARRWLVEDGIFKPFTDDK